MPNRILRDWTDSEKIDSLDCYSERFFLRLIMKVDDYGRYPANLKLLKSYLFPLRTDISETDIAYWMTACEKANLITLYVVTSKEFLQITNFKQVLRQKQEKYPPPDKCDADATQMLSIRIADASTKRNESETNQKRNEGEGELSKIENHTNGSPHPHFDFKIFAKSLFNNKEFLDSILRKHPKNSYSDVQEEIYKWVNDVEGKDENEYPKNEKQVIARLKKYFETEYSHLK